HLRLEEAGKWYWAPTPRASLPPKLVSNAFQARRLRAAAVWRVPEVVLRLSPDSVRLQIVALSRQLIVRGSRSLVAVRESVVCDRCLVLQNCKDYGPPGRNQT